MDLHTFYALFGLFLSYNILKTLKLTHLNLKQWSESINQRPNTVNDPIAYNTSSNAYFDQKMLFLERRNPQSDQNPKHFQFHLKQIQFPIDCATSRPNRSTELRDMIENRIFFC